VVDVGSRVDKRFSNFYVASLDCGGEGGLSFGSDVVGVSIVGEEKVGYL
jgi:hypothetical protein